MKTSPDIVVRDEIDTDFGIFVAGFSETGLAELSFPGTAGRQCGSPGKNRGHPEVAATRSAISAMLAGKIPSRIPRLDLSAGTDFQQAVWRALVEIPVGRPINYGELAWRIGCPGGARAVGSACGANPVPVIVPCHRVIATRGRIGGFSGGLDWKVRLLAIEGFQLFAPPD